MSKSDNNSSYERIVPQIGIAVASIVFALQMTNDASLAAAMIRAFSVGVAVTVVLLLSKVAFMTALRFGRYQPPPANSEDEPQKDKKPEAPGTTDRSKASTRVAA